MIVVIATLSGLTGMVACMGISNPTNALYMVMAHRKPVMADLYYQLWYFLEMGT